MAAKSSIAGSGPPSLTAPAPIGLFSIAELSLALGRSNVVHAGLKGGGASRKLLREVRRLGLYIGLEAVAACAFKR